jgi:hypothetical protein
MKFLATVALLTVIGTPAFAQSSSGSTAPQSEKTVVRQRGPHSFAMVPGPGSSRVPQFDYRRGTSSYPFGPGYNVPYPDRPYGDPDHW